MRPTPGSRAVRRAAALALGALAVLAAGACGTGGAGAPAAGPTATRFDAQRAFADLRMQVRMGPRPAGSAASRALAERLRARLPGGRFEDVPGGLRNVVGQLPGRGRPILLGAHYDTKDIPGFVGADDGAGGVATVLGVARALAVDRRACLRPLRIVMFDGEESPRGSRDFRSDGLRGSSAYAASHAGELHAAVVVDLVADRDLAIPREAGSDARLWARLRAAAAAVGAGSAFPPGPGPTVLDDHIPFLEAGVPSIDLIDFDYPPWHTTADTLDRVSARSLDLAGETLVRFLGRMRAAPCARA